MSAARFSSLPVLQYCGKPLELAELHGSGNRATAIGTAHHARCAGSDDAAALFARLSEPEQAECLALIVPDVAHVDGLELRYSDATKEARCELLDAGEVVCVGTVDMFWHVSAHNALYVADIKRSARTVEPDSLQIVGYALALAQTLDVDVLVCGVFDASEGTWKWGTPLELLSDEHEEIHARVVAAARNHGGEFNAGNHCHERCYQRERCPAYLLPLELVDTTLAPFTVPGGITTENASQALLAANRASDTAEVVQGLLRQFARDNGGIVDAERNKVWKGSTQKGRAGLDRARLETDHPTLLQDYITRGADFERFGWVNGPKAPKEPKARKGKVSDGGEP